MKKTIVFQGDSITDCDRNREDSRSMGTGYPLLVKSQLGLDCPEQFECWNTGVSGNRIVDLYARAKKDTINLKPDCLSILVGVNDVWHELEEQNGVDAEEYEKVYCMLIEKVQKSLPDIKIIILEPFCLRASATDNTPQNPNKWDIFHTEVAKRAEKAKLVAQRYGLCFVPLQQLFDQAAKTTSSAAYWLFDGVHPTEAGHELIKREWLKAFEGLR